MAERDESGRKILGKSSSENSPVVGSTNGLPARRVLGQSTTGAISSNQDSGADGLGGGRTGGNPFADRDRRKRMPRIKTLVLIAICLLALVPVGSFVFGWLQFSKIPTVNVSAVLSPRGSRSGTNYLIVGTDSRAGIDVSDPNSGAFLSGEVSGSRTDTIMVLHVDGSTTQLTSIPRDLWVTDPATGEKGRINSTFASGPSNLILAVEALGIPVDQYLEINFVSFGRLVDAVGGITIDFPYPAVDNQSGLSIANAGPNRLNGTEALAYVRSRYYTELVNGKPRVDGTADIGRNDRQRVFLTSLLREVSGERNPFQLFSLPGSLGAGMKRGSTFSYFDAIDLAWTMKDASPEAVVIPVTPRRTSGGADVLDLQSDARNVINGLAA
ncbi:MAG: LCP family protein [Actinomycetia bacterium]|nr:LCP family protein [Actinomycetes bacterium]